MIREKENIRLLFGGDIAGRRRFDKIAQEGRYEDYFGDTLEDIRNSDYSVINLEAPLVASGNPIPKSGPNIKTHENTANVLNRAGIGLACLANNHIMDYGEDGLKSTIDKLTSSGIDYCGVGKTQKEASDIFYKEICNKRFAFINIAENEFGNATDTKPGAASLNPVLNSYKIKEATREADYVIVVVHGGHETFEYPSQRMRDTYRFFIDCGADAVIGHHTHCFSGHEIYNGKPIIYSLGNFIFDNGSKNVTSWNFGVIALLDFSENKIHLQLKCFTQGLPDGEPAPKYLLPKEMQSFLELANQKSKIIVSDSSLKEKFDEFVNINNKKYSLYLEPTSNKYLLGLVSKGIIKSFWDSKRRRLLWNIMRCEAHRDILLSILKKSNNR